EAGVESPEDLAHAAFPQRSLDPIGTKLGTGGERRLGVFHQQFIWWTVEDSFARGVLLEQDFHLTAQIVVAPAGRGKERAAVVGLPRASRMVEILYPAPALGLHGLQLYSLGPRYA